MKKLNKLFAILVAMAMVLSLGVVSAFAANPSATSTTAGKSVPTKITKAYNKAEEGVGAPSIEVFHFTAEPQTVTGYKTYGSDVKKTAENLTVADLFANIDFTTPGAGKYRFYVTEDAPTTADGYDEVTGRVAKEKVTSDDGKFITTETTEFSKAKYQVDLIVASNTTETGTTYYVQSAAVTRLADDDGDESDPGKEQAGPFDGDGINLTFTNKVNKEIVKNPEDETPTTKNEDKQALEISKDVALVEGKTGTIPDQEFNFKATVTFPANTKATSYTTVIKEMDGETVKVVKAGPTFTKTDNVKTFTLKAGQWLAFTDVEAGANVTVVEDTYPGFSTDSTLTKTVSDEGGNAIDVLNKYDPEAGSVTGILMSNIPYIVLALVAIGGLCAYVVVRRKNADEA